MLAFLRRLWRVFFGAPARGLPRAQNLSVVTDERLLELVGQQRDHQIWIRRLPSAHTWYLLDAKAPGALGRAATKGIHAWVVAYASGEIVDTSKPTPLPRQLPEGTFFIETRASTQVNALPTLGELVIGANWLRIEHTKPKREHYTTSVTNIGATPVRVLRFGAFGLLDGVFVLRTVTGDLFTAAQFAEWYGASEWIAPGETVSDPNNYGWGCHWVYQAETATGIRFWSGSKVEEATSQGTRR